MTAPRPHSPDPAGERVVIVGAGVTGLTLAVTLAEAGLPVTVVERLDRPGGLARSFRYGEFTFDIGPHRFHTDVPRVDALIRQVLGPDAREIPRCSWVRFEGEFYPWPLHPSYVLLKFPPGIALGALSDLFSLMRRPPPATFRDQIVNMYGETLYRHFFEGYSAKFLGITPELTHPDWAQTGVDRAIIDKRLKMRSLGQLLFSMMLPRRLPELRFLYAVGGCQRYTDNLSARLLAAGGELLCGRGVDGITARGRRVTAVTVGERTLPCAELVWSGTVHALARLLGLPAPDLRYLALVCYNLMLTDGKRLPFQWCYHGAPDVIFSRVSIPENFEPSNTPPGRRSLCVEVTCAEGDALFRRPEEKLERVIFDLEREGLLKAEREVLDARWEPVRWAYPIYAIDYRQKRAALRRDLAQLDNLHAAGRLGRFWYNNMDHCIEASLALAEQILGRWGSPGPGGGASDVP